METHKTLARADEILHAVLFGFRQGQVTKIRETFPAGIKDQRIVAAHVSGMGQDCGVFCNSHLMPGGAQKRFQDRGGFMIRVPASGKDEELHQ
jgi:hypothetical protein